MTYTVSSGTLNSTVPYHTVAISLFSSLPHCYCLQDPDATLPVKSLASNVTEDKVAAAAAAAAAAVAAASTPFKAPVPPPVTGKDTPAKSAVERKLAG